MHKRLIEEGFNRRYVLRATAAVHRTGGNGLRGHRDPPRPRPASSPRPLRERQDVMRVLAEIIYKALEAESAQRGFLLTGEAKYLTPAGGGHRGRPDWTRRLRSGVTRNWHPEEVPVLQQGQARTCDSKGDEMRRSVALLKQNQPVPGHGAGEVGHRVESDASMRESPSNRCVTRERARIFAGHRPLDRGHAAQHRRQPVRVALFTIAC